MKLHNNLGQKLGKVASLSAVLLALFGNAYAEEQVLDSTAAVVNNGIILESELNAHTQKLLSQYAATGAKVDEITARRQALNAIKNGANVAEVAAKYATSEQSADMGYIPETAIPLPFLPAILNAKPGDVIGPFRSSIGMHIIKLYDVSHSAVTPIKTYDAAHILIKTSIIYSDEAAVAKLKDIASEINKGTITFAQAAKQYSEDPGSAIKGGDLGYAVADIYDPNFARALTQLHVGQMSQPVKSAFGWHLILLKDTRVDRDSLEVFKEKANSIIFEREFNEAVTSWERSLREMAYIHVIDPELVNSGVSLDQDNKGKNTLKPTNDDQGSQQYSENSRLLN